MPQRYYLQTTTPLDKKIHTTKSYWDYIAKRKHPEIKGKKQLAIETLKNPGTIKHSTVDERVFLYYQKIKDKYFCVVTKHLNSEGFIITVYITKKLARGETIWQSPRK